MSKKLICGLTKSLIAVMLICFASSSFAQQEQNDSPIDEATRKKFAKAQPEDITNENFPDLIDSFDYPNADISEVVKAISKLTGKNFIVDPAASRGKITIIAPSQITVAEAYKAFLSALAINNLTVVPSGNFLKIRQVTTAQNDSIETYTDYFPNTDQVITRIVKLKYISAEDLSSKIKYLKSRQGILEAYGPTNSLIITDFGSNIERISRILAQLDVPGYEEQLSVIRIYNAKAKEIQTLVDQIINKGESKNSRNVPRFRRKKSGSSKTGAESYSLVVSDERTNSIVVMGNKAGIKRIKALVKKLDFPLNPEDAGGVYVYYVRHGVAEKIANVINGVATDSKKANDAKTGGSGVTPRPKSGSTSSAAKSAGGTSLFGGEVKVTADETTNSLIVTASRQDYEVMKGLLAKIDIPRDQVFVKAIIMEMRAEKQNNWGISYYKFKEGTGGLGRIGFGGLENITSLLSPLGGAGAILGFGAGKSVSIPNPAGGDNIEVKSLTGLVNFIKTNNNGNILSSPQITVMDNEEANIAVGQTIPVGSSNTVSTTGTTSAPIFKEATIDLTIKPQISPDTDQVQMEIEQKIKQLASTQVLNSQQGATATTNDRNVKTRISVDSGDTAVIGGLMQDTEEESMTKVPILGDIPILGWLFKSTKSSKSKLNLVMFITPKILRNADDGADIVNNKINERIDFIQSYMNGKDPHGYNIDSLPRKASRRSSKPEVDLDIEDALEQDFNPEVEEPAVESF